MRQNERRIKFIRLRDAVRRAGQLQRAKPFHKIGTNFYSFKKEKISIRMLTFDD